MTGKLLRILSAIVTLFLSGCGIDGSYSVKNGGDSELNEVVIEIGRDHRFACGVLLGYSEKAYLGPMEVDNTNEVVLKWRGEHGAEGMATSTVSRNELRDDRSVVFTIMGDGTIEKSWRF